jgi:hypothetical protein
MGIEEEEKGDGYIGGQGATRSRGMAARPRRAQRQWGGRPGGCCSGRTAGPGAPPPSPWEGRRGCSLALDPGGRSGADA